MSSISNLPHSGFGKIFSSMYTGSLMGAGPVVMAVWPYVIAQAQPPGVVEIVPKYLAAVIGCSPEEIQAAVDFLCAEDPDSRTPAHNGRRLIKLDGHMYHVPTWSQYRAKRDDEDRKAYFREAKRRERSKKRHVKKSLTVRDCPQCPTLSTQAEAEAEAEAETKTETYTASKGGESEGREGQVVAAYAAPVVSSPESPKAEPKRAKPALPDDEWLKEVAARPGYQRLNVPLLYSQMVTWCEVRNRTPSRKMFINWLNRQDQPMSVQQPEEKKQPYLT